MRTQCKADRGIHQLKGLSPVAMEHLTVAVKAARKADKKDKALRSIAREVRLWHKRHNDKPQTRIYGHLISQQDGIADKIIVATV